jgi:hypothetical protein
MLIMAKHGVAARAKRNVKTGRVRVDFMMLIGREGEGKVSGMHLASRKPTEQVPWAFEEN